MPFQSYIDNIKKRFASGIAREHAYRPALQTLLEALIPGITATNDPAQIDCGAPDFILTRHGVEVGHIEAKDIGADLDKTENSEQLQRYVEGLDNLILTDYLEFRFFLHQEKVETVRIGRAENGKIVPIPENFDRLKTLLLDFAAFQGQTIKSAKKLAVIMARKARLMRDVFFRAVSRGGDNTLKDQLKAFKAVLVHDMDEAQFADVYAQTITYGLFTARLHDKSLEDFSRTEAYGLVPRSNPFLRQLFHYIAGPDLDDRVVWIVDGLCEVYRAADLRKILKDFGTATGQNDPILHFYETFLAEYNPKLRKSRGVWYTPEAVVNFIIRAIDDILKTRFNLREGLADNSKIEIEVETEVIKRGKRQKEKRRVHRVQLLDVATGTGTFLAEVVKQIYRRFKGQEGVWSSYVENDLLPRMHGFELLMASYAMCHLKLDLLLQETGYKPSDPKKPPRVSVYLTNSLEEHHPDVGTFFATWLSREANEASRIKKDMPIMVAFGNPPYSGHSVNKGTWVDGLLDVYKQEPGGGRLKERNPKWLNDDYVKFIRLGEHFIAKNGEGILGYITNHSYLDNPTFRGMRWHLLKTFDEIFILDLHGNAKKKEMTPDGKPDKNVFDIQQGVAIIVGVKKRGKKKKDLLGKVYHADLWGSRERKYDCLQSAALAKVQWQRLKPALPECFFVPKDTRLTEEYRKGFAVNEIFPVNSVGIVTARDGLTIHEKREDLIKTIGRFANLPVEEARQEFKLGKDVQDWSVPHAQKDLKDSGLSHENIHRIDYRPFDIRWTYYTGKSRGFLCRPRSEIMQNFLGGNNLALITMRQYAYEVPEYCYSFVTRHIIDNRYFISNKGICLSCPLYLYPSGLNENKSLNLDPKIYGKIKETVPRATPESLFDYIYAVLHSPVYRKRYAEFLKTDFPRIPYPKDAKTFDALAKLGGELRALHLMESPKLEKPITTYPAGGDHEVVKPRFEKAKVWINLTQYFGGVPEEAWEFYIGGYQPAQKWLKDRKGRKLSADDIRHYQRIIVALTETGKIMEKIGKIDRALF